MPPQPTLNKLALVAGFFNVRLSGAYGLEHRKQAYACLQVLCEGQRPELSEQSER